MAIQNALKQRFSGKLEFSLEGTRGATGFLEVQIVGGPLLHSKKNGDGYVDSAEKMQRIIDGVETHLTLTDK